MDNVINEYKRKMPIISLVLWGVGLLIFLHKATKAPTMREPTNRSMKNINGLLTSVPACGGDVPVRVNIETDPSVIGFAVITDVQ